MMIFTENIKSDKVIIHKLVLTNHNIIVNISEIIFMLLTFRLVSANIILLWNANSQEVLYMPLTMANTGEENIIKKVGGNPETRKFLESLGFVSGGTVTVISEISGNLIVNVKDSRVAVSREMAVKIII